MTFGEEVEAVAPAKLSERLGRIADLLESSGIDLDEVGRIDKVRVGEYTTTVKVRNEDGSDSVEQVVNRADSLVITPAWENGPEWPVAQPGPSVKLPKLKLVPWADGTWRRVVILPDIQAGYYRDIHGELQPIMDEAAVALAINYIVTHRPDLIILLGDNLDLAEWGKYLVTPAFMQTTQATINWCTCLCARLRAAAPEARIVWLAGNHEERMPKYLAMNAAASFGLRRGWLPEEAPSTWPVLSVPELCRMDEFGVEYLPGYPASHFWITEKWKAIHGDRVKSRGSTAHVYLNEEKVSVTYGHVHRREYAALTRDDFDGPKEIMASSPGCLARIDGVVPSTKGGLDLDGRPLRRTENWQQGFAVGEFCVETGNFTYQNVAIHSDGDRRWARHDGKSYEVAA